VWYNTPEENMPYVITCGDEGIQINEGTRIAVLGAGLKLDGFPEVVKGLKKVLGRDLCIAASAECEWVKEQFQLDTFEQADATMQQQLAASADETGLRYVGILPFADPQQLDHGVKGHMVRPKSVHIANKVCFTLAGGEQKFHLGHFVISAEWVAQVPKKIASQVIKTQVDHYTKLAKQPLTVEFESAGELDEKIVKKNRAVLESIGYKA
jgi:hypothetical protein